MLYKHLQRGGRRRCLARRETEAGWWVSLRSVRSSEKLARGRPEFKPLSNLSPGSHCPHACTEHGGQSTVLPVSMDLAYGRLFYEFTVWLVKCGCGLRPLISTNAGGKISCWCERGLVSPTAVCKRRAAVWAGGEGDTVPCRGVCIQVREAIFFPDLLPQYLKG